MTTEKTATLTIPSDENGNTIEVNYDFQELPLEVRVWVETPLNLEQQETFRWEIKEHFGKYIDLKFLN